MDDIGDVTITNDGATILQQLEVEHPAAKVRRITYSAVTVSHITALGPAFSGWSIFIAIRLCSFSYSHTHTHTQVLVELAHLQDQEVGDGTTSVVIVAAELLKRGNELVKNKVHPTSIMSGYRLALKEAVKFIKDKLIVPVDQLKQENLMNAAKTSMSSKILGPESEFFANLAVQAVLSVKSESEGDGGKKIIKYPVR